MCFVKIGVPLWKRTYEKYDDFDYIEYQEAGENEIGYLRFQNSKFQSNPDDDIIFFFSKCENVQQTYSYIDEKIKEAINNAENSN